MQSLPTWVILVSLEIRQGVVSWNKKFIFLSIIIHRKVFSNSARKRCAQTLRT